MALCHRLAVQEPKTVTEYFAGRSFKDEYPAGIYTDLAGAETLEKGLRYIQHKADPQAVMWDMLATKAQDRTYLRNRRTHLLMCLKKPGTLDSLTEAMDAMGFHEAPAVIADDLEKF